MKKNSWIWLIIALMGFSFLACNMEKDRIVAIETEFGTMKVRLYNSTPKHRDNFIKLAEEGFYDGTLFHRVISGFMIQGGDPDSRSASPGQPLGQGGPGYEIDAEIGAIHTKGAVAAARTADQMNPERKSSGSQFYIVHGVKQSEGQLAAIEQQKGIQYTPEQKELYKTVGGAPNLDMDYTVFGEVIEGMDVIDKIASQPGAAGNRPANDIKMTVKVLK